MAAMSVQAASSVAVRISESLAGTASTSGRCSSNSRNLRGVCWGEAPLSQPVLRQPPCPSGCSPSFSSPPLPSISSSQSQRQSCHSRVDSNASICGDTTGLLPFPHRKQTKRAVFSNGNARGQSQSRGRVGTVNREGNVGVASFGPSRGSQSPRAAQKVDLAKMISGAMPLVVLATAVAALSHPPSFSWFKKQYYAPALGGIMLSIGVQLSVADFALVFKQPTPVLAGYLAQYMLKPALGYLAVTAFGVPPMFASGLLLTACVAGAQLSSYAAYLSGGDVALSIVLTSVTTITSVVVTPLLTQLLIGAAVPIDVVGMAKSIMQVVVGPVFLGLALNTYARRQVDAVRPYVPLVGMLCTSLCIGSPLAMNRAMLLNPAGVRLLAPVIAFHVAAFAAGYWFSKLPLWKMDERAARTISLCTGMQSSTLAMLLATQFFGTTAAVPPACSVVFMALSGLTLATFWGRGYGIGPLLKSMGRNMYLSKQNREGMEMVA